MNARYLFYGFCDVGISNDRKCIDDLFEYSINKLSKNPYITKTEIRLQIVHYVDAPNGHISGIIYERLPDGYLISSDADKKFNSHRLIVDVEYTKE